MVPETDHAAVFAAAPNPYLLLGPDLVVADVNDAYLEVTGRTRRDVLGRHAVDAFPGAVEDADTDGVPSLRASLEQVLATRRARTMPLRKYTVEVPDRPGVYEERWWSPSHTPVLGTDGTVAWIIHRVEDMTDFAKAYRAGGRSEPVRELEAESYVRARELLRLNEELRRAHERERQVAMTLQEAMLQAPDLARHRNIAVRYLPATGSLNICGDWYDVVDLAADRFAVAVGDVIGHGLDAAAVMGMLRSALSAAVRAVERPAQALEVLGLYARSIEGAMGTTAVKALIDIRSRLIMYSSAGHPPPVLAHPGGGYELLDQATDPPLGVRPVHVPRPQASLPYSPGDTLVLYTDGLIERRGEDIDVGLRRLTDTLARCGELDSGSLADALLDGLGVGDGGRDDIALVVIRL
ncbi:hypothetical protein GCM10027168_12340 [Streptomyces capparidis]